MDEAFEIYAKETEQLIGGWNTDVVSMKRSSLVKCTEEEVPSTIHVIFLFLPGNPGCIAWYIPLLRDILGRVSQRNRANTKLSFELRACSYAGHGVGDHKTNPVSGRTVAVDAHTLEGQINHKLKWMDSILKDRHDDIDDLRFIWLSHSIGSYLVQEILLRRPQPLLQQTMGVIHLMPFIRFDPSLLKQYVSLNVVAQTTQGPKAPAMRLLRFASRAVSLLPEDKLDALLQHSAGIQCPHMRDFTAKLIVQHSMVDNFLILGCHEIRMLKSSSVDEISFNVIGQCCPIAVLYGGIGPDQWAPKTHHDDLLEMQSQGRVPASISCTYHAELKHDFVVNTEYMTPIVSDYCVDTIGSFLHDGKEPSAFSWQPRNYPIMKARL